MVYINPNWPVVRDAWIPGLGFLGGEVAPVGESAAPPTDLSARSRGQFSANRGKLYELDETRTGQLTVAWQNQDGAFNPVNTASPFAPGVLPYRRFQRTCQWPPTANLLTGDQASAGQATPLATGTLLTATSLNMISDYDSAAQIAASASAWSGSQVFQAIMPAAAVAGSSIITVPCQPIQVPIPYNPAETYTWSVYVRCVTAAASVTVTPGIVWTSTAGMVVGTSVGAASVLAGGATATWTRIQVSGMPPAGAIAANLIITYTSGPSTTFTMQAAGLQVELDPTASGWVQPGVWYPQFSGWVERFPQSWTMGGTYGTVTPTVVDSLSFLSQTIMQDPFVEQVLSMTPRFFYPLNDATGSTTFQDITGNNNAATSIVQAGSTGTIAAGQGVQSQATGSGIGGITGTVVTFTNPPYGGNNGPSCLIALPLSCPAGVPATSGWTRMMAFRATAGNPSVEADMWTAYAGVNPFFIRFIIDGTGNLEVWCGLFNSLHAVVIPTQVVTDSNWHLVVASLSNNGLTLSVWLDGVLTTETMPGTIYPLQLLTDSIGSYNSSANFTGDLAHFAEFDYPMTSAQVATLYGAWRTGFSGDSTGTRYGRILGWAGYTGPSSIDGGITTAMGPATDITGLDSLSCLNAVTDTENGDHYVSAGGVLTFKQRSARYNQLVPLYTFGENVAAGEFPYEDVKIDFDPTRLVTRAQVTQFVTSQMYQYPTNSSSAQQAYGTYTLQRTINVANGSEALSAAQYLVGQFQQPMLRLEALRLHPAAYPQLWPVCLSLEIGMRVRVMKRPPAPAPAIQFDGFIEQVAWNMSDQGDAVYNVQISPADLTEYWLAAALHTTLASAAAASQPTITCSRLPDYATNPFAGSICSGMQLTLDPGTAIAETLTVHSVQTTTAGYSTCQITFTGNLAHSHTTGAVVCDALPAGDTNPAYWDLAADLGTSTVLAY